MTIERALMMKNNVPAPPLSLWVLGITSGANTGSFSVIGKSQILVYGCGGGGSGGGAPADGSSAGGGGGGASQVYGYTLSTTPGETLTYSVGGPGQATTISRSGSVIFQLNPGSAGYGMTGGAGGTLTAYSSTQEGLGQTV